MKPPVRHHAILAMTLALALAALAWAGQPTDEIKASVDQVIKILQDPALRGPSATAERRAEIRKAADGIFDFPEITKRALGRHWNALKDADREEFIRLFTDLLERSYISKIERYTGEKVAYTGEVPDGGVVTVNTHFTTKEGTQVPLDYRMERKGDRWWVYDVLIEGVSLTSNYRTQFDHIIQTSSYQELVKRLKARLASGRDLGETPRAPSRKS